MAKYNAESIKVLKNLEAVRLRFDMYVGSKDYGAYHILHEALDNSIDEFMNGYGTTVELEYNSTDNSVVVRDDGRGIPVGIIPEQKKSAMEVLLTVLHSGGKFGKTNFSQSAGQNGIGIKTITALTESLKVSSKPRDDNDENKTYYMTFSKGKKLSELKESKKDFKFKHGTEFKFIPDTEIFEEFSNYDANEIEKDFEMRSYINKGVKNVFYLDGKKKKTFYHPEGIKELIQTYLKKPMIEEPIYIEKEVKSKSKEIENGIDHYEIVLSFDNKDEEKISSFVNGIPTSSGTHETGLKQSLTTVFNKYIKDNKLLPKKMENIEIKGEDIRSGLVAIINLKLTTTPNYKGQTKDELSNPEIRGIISRIISAEMEAWFLSHPKEAKTLCQRIVAFAKGRDAASKYRENIVNLNATSAGLSYSVKFKDCNSDDPTKRELYLAEGDSASTNILMCRNPEFQASFSLRGKPLNSYGMEDALILKNAEFSEIIKIVFNSTDIKHVDYQKIKFNKIIIMSDSDIDGKRLTCLPS